MDDPGVVGNISSTRGILNETAEVTKSTYFVQLLMAIKIFGQRNRITRLITFR